MDDVLHLLHDRGETDDEKLLLLVGDRQCNLHTGLPYFKYDRFNIFELREDECEVEFCFKKDDIFRLAAALHLPEVFRCQNCVLVDTVEGLCIVTRFAYPCRYADLIPLFGRPVSQLCMVANLVVDYVNDRFGYLLTDLDQSCLSRQCLQMFANAIHNKGAALDNCWGFIDWTVRPICRLGEHQRIFYNGHKRLHAIKLQSVVTPNGMIANLYGPMKVEGMIVAYLQCQVC